MSKASKLSAMSASARREKVVAKVREAMATIEREIEDSRGVYVGGRLSLNEVCRKAGVHPITMQGPAHRATTKPMVLAWLGKLKAGTDTGKRQIRSRVTQRARTAEEEVRLLATNFQIRENEFARMNEENARMVQRIADLEAEVLRLQTLVSEGRVVQMPKKGR